MGAFKPKGSSSVAGAIAARRRDQHAAVAEAADSPSAVAVPGAADVAKKPFSSPGGGDAGVHFGSMRSYRGWRLIGEGAFGAVFRARHIATGETVAIKIAHKDSDDEALLREAGTLAACAGIPAVVTLREVARGAKTGRLHLVMDYVGPSLADYLTRRVDDEERALTEAETQSIMRQLLTGVKQMHERGVFHRDIKPGNVLVGAADGRVRICDFGLGKSAARAPPHTQLVGTLWYMAPEQYLGSKDYGPAVDMWALGCLMAELLTGETLFPGDTEYLQLVLVAGLLGVPDEVNGMGLGVTTPSRLRTKVPVQKLSQPGFDVLDGLLQYVAGDRLTAAAALEMPWFSMKLS
ncbi:putative cyclin-dependent kinase F-2 [Oryza brachyantha]|uniref:putative cyclin-dependent kinase F-2 n=1 Tax=Oryza brachyantha TaxID=4533 RepID=UPI001ADC56D9|nr:putative cyclin-dependent kinase F-2 [Oryza brachyantha]